MLGDDTLRNKALRVVLAFAACMALAFSACASLGCSGQQVAATVCGQQILEEDVTAYVDNFRSYGSMQDDESWANFLASSNTDAAGFRKTAINALAESPIMEAKASELGLQVTDDEVESSIQKARETAGAAYVTDDSLWDTYLSNYGQTQETYKEQMRLQLLEAKICQQEVSQEDASDDEVLSYVNSKVDILNGTETIYLRATNYNAIFYLHQYLEGLDKGDIKDALGVIGALKTMDESDLTSDLKKAKEFLEDAELEEADVWDCVTTMDDWYTEITDDMKSGELYPKIADDSQGTFYIIYCCDKYKAPSKGFKSIKAAKKSLPQSLYEQVASYATTNKYNSSCKEYLQQVKDAAEITINEMPSGLSYDVEPAQTGDFSTDDSASQEAGENSSQALENKTESKSSD